MNDLQIFNFNENQLRTITKNGEPWFVAKDVCDVLGLGNSRDAISKLDEEEKGAEKIDTLGGRQTMAVINESGLYTLIIRSNMPVAKPFRKYVTGEVLPSVRKHGAYMTPETLMKSLSDPQYVIGLLNVLSETQNQLNINNQIIGELKPKADYLDLILKGKSLMTITQIAKDYGMTGEKMNQLLKQFEIQFSQNGQWLLYSKHADKRYTSSKLIPITRSDGRIDMILNTQWTQKGRMFIYQTLKKEGILPTIEREN
jgi:prophage antirepressor-like protein